MPVMKADRRHLAGWLTAAIGASIFFVACGTLAQWHSFRRNVALGPISRRALAPGFHLPTEPDANALRLIFPRNDYQRHLVSQVTRGAVAQASQKPDPRSASLPPESAVPQTDSLAPSAANLPSEGRLPGDVDDSPPPPALPGEDRTPDDHPVGNEPEDRTSAALPGQIQPLLRLDFEGHTDTIRTLDLGNDGRTMVSAGDDKDLHVWRRSNVSESGWLHLRTVRWPITRGPRGRIYSASLGGDLAAFAGHGAFGGLGEIRVVNSESGELAFEPLSGKHRQVIASLAWPSGDQSRLASVDGEGQVVLWHEDEVTGLWEGTTLVENDSVTFGEATAAALQPYRVFVPMTFLGKNHVVVAHYDRPGATTALWHLAKIDVRDGSTTVLKDLDHAQHVVDCCATPDGRFLASCDWGGSIAIWQFEGDAPPTAKIIRTTAPPLVIDLDPDGKRLLVGTRVFVEDDNNPSARLQLWDVQADPPVLLSQKTLADNVRSAKLDMDHNEAIVSQGNRIELHALDGAGAFADTAAKRLEVPASPVLNVAFSNNSDGYQVAFGSRIDDQGQPSWDGVFDFSASKLVGRGPIDPSDYLSPQRTSARWRVSVPIQTAEGVRLGLMEAEKPRGVLPLRYEVHGFPTAICTLPVPATGAEEAGEKPDTGAVIVGTNGRNDIYVFAADQSDPPRLLRHFRGHSGAVRSLTTSADGRYLVSGAEDMTMAVWNLQGLLEADETTINRWGVDFEAEGDELIAAEVREDGPLYFRGVRDGDRLLSIEWVDDAGQTQSQSDAEKIFEHLLNVPFDQLVVFRFSRLGRPRPGLQSYPAWRPLATVFVDNTREWAFWTPAGYYDASFNGHQRFGWQVNRGIDRTPDFFRAAQFRQALERPEIMKRLLAAGSLPAAMRVAPEGDVAIINQYQNKPTIELLEPEAGKLIEGDLLTVKAAISVPLGATLVDPKAFVSGVPAVSRRLVASPASDAENRFTYQWEFRLPSDPLLQLELLASTEAEAVERVVVNLDHATGKKKTTPRLHLLAMGVGSYPDPQIPSLDFAAAAASDVASLFRTRASGLYRVTTDQLVDQDATRSLWRIFAAQAVAELRSTVSPDDLVVMYLCGHGMRDRRTNQWYFVTADARYSDLMNDEYSGCVAFSDLAALAELPCRKLAILDSCHSGAVQPVMQRDDLKSALRFLQDDLVLTVTASEGDEEAAEQRETRMGRFTAKLVEALGGAADQGGDQADGIVTLNEMIDYVTRAVADESEQEGMPQHPTASPAYLLRTMYLPLAAVKTAQ